MIGNRPYCRLFTRANESGVFVVATDGYRLHSMHLNATARHEQPDFDEPLSLDVIRHVAKTKSDRIGISVDKDRAVVHEGSTTHPYTSFPPTDGLSLAGFERVLNTEGVGATVVTGVNRTAAHKAMKALPRKSRRDELCRVAIKNPGGLLFWATCANLVGPMYPPDQELKAPVKGPQEELVFGIIRRNLVGTFQFMTAKEVDITVYSPTMPIRITSTDGREVVLMSSARLT